MTDPAITSGTRRSSQPYFIAANRETVRGLLARHRFDCIHDLVEYLHAALTLASNHGLGAAIVELDLTDRPACCVELAENDRRPAPVASEDLSSDELKSSRATGCRTNST